MEASREEIQQIRDQTGKSKVTAGLELLNRAFDDLQSVQIRALLFVLENDFQMPLYQIVRSLRDGNAK
ncbi:MAG: hypothetical protein NTX98_03580 [Candidatus Doudnabacteria bacterium]|nr:hypothetical protein [Candidatus Doudnabacteria bacterium]